MAKTATPTAPPTLYVAVADFYSFHEDPNQAVPVQRGAIARGEHSIVSSNPGVWQRLVVDFDTYTETEDQ
jgi:hypothetical protein